MALGLKRHETRPWSTTYRGWLAIHAAAELPDYAVDVYEASPLVRMALEKGGVQKPEDLYRLPLGAILCVVNLWSCRPTSSGGMNLWKDQDDWLPKEGSMERELGNYGPDRYVWLTKDLHVLEYPVAFKGHQGLRDAPPEIAEQVFRQAGINALTLGAR